MKKYSLLLLIICNLLVALPEHIIIRKGIDQDLPAIYTFDRIVSYEYFVPLYAQGYAHLPLGKNPEYFLALELENDAKWFPECIHGNGESLWIAYDQHANTIAGLMVAHQSTEEKIELDLLLVSQEYRGKGIGRALIQQAINEFSDASIFEVYPLKFANDATVAFYITVGFINQGAATIDKVNTYGIPYKDMYYHFTYAIPSNHIKQTSSIPIGTIRLRSIR